MSGVATSGTAVTTDGSPALPGATPHSEEGRALAEAGAGHSRQRRGEAQHLGFRTLDRTLTPHCRVHPLCARSTQAFGAPLSF